MDNLFLYLSLIISSYYILIAMKILIDQYYSLARLYKSKISLILQRKKLYLTCTIFLFSGLLLFYFQQYYLSYTITLLVFYVGIIEISLKNYHFTRRNIFLLSLTLVINLFLSLLTFKFSTFLGLLLMLVVPNISLIISYYLLLPIEGLIKNHYIKMARKKIIDNHYLVIGVTGSFGKTTTKNFIYEFLKDDYLISRQNHNYNTVMGLCKYINNEVRKEDQILLVELGVDKAHTMQKFSKLFSLDYAIVTSIGEMHLATFKNIDNIAKEKLSISKLLKPNGKIFLHQSIIERFNSYIDFDYVPYNEDDLQVNKELFYSVNFNNQWIMTPILIKKQLASLTLALKIADEFKIPPQRIAFNLEKLQIPSRRLNFYQHQNFFVIDNSYNGNLEGVLEVIDSIKDSSKEKIVITGGLIELGEKYAQYNEILGQNLNIFQKVILVSNNKNHPLTNKLEQDKYIRVNTYQEVSKVLESITTEAILLLLCTGNEIFLQ